MKQGIDVSYCQKNFDFNEAVNQGKEFCIVRIGTGNGHGSYSSEMDSLFFDNVNGAKNAGMDVGIYYFLTATTSDEAVKEAQWLCDAIRTNLQGWDLKVGIWLDVETDAQKALGQQALTDVVMAFVNEVNRQGFYIGVYSYYDIYTNCMDLSQIPDYVPLWPASTETNTNYIKQEHPDKNCPYWQYSDTGNIAGIDVDLDIMYEEGE